MPLKPGGRQPPLAHGMQTVNCLGRPSSQPVNETITSVERVFWQTTQVATSALLPLAFSLGIAGPHLVRSESATTEVPKGAKKTPDTPVGLLRRTLTTN